ncbi:maestro heat-like repeat-containing protein family member 2B isoform X2 [Cuculus canorus]|uniref:maestro heat-like repeat-containing protein family member 2B isoform X2 n=1 Tax=Cuculus canorus TaxID=55661 RepID=UPI0023AAE915|nr:maestro heat-like repeat-containing protein family member 2B isoform X2 [Cuculus canorus]
MGLLAREMCMVKDYFCHRVALQLLDVLNLDEPCLEVPAMAFFVKLLACPDVVELHERALKLFPMFVLSPRIEMRRLVLQGLFTLSQRPEMAERMGFLLPKLLEVLDDADPEVVEMTLSVLGKMLEQRDVAIAGPVVVQLSEKLQPLFDNESASIKVLSFQLFRDVMELLVAVDRKATKRQVRRNLLPLLFHVYDENQPVAEASRETLLQATELLKLRKLRKKLKSGQIYKLGKCLLAEDRSRREDYLYQALPYLQSPQESLREAAVVFFGHLGRSVRGQPEEQQTVYQALRCMRNDISQSVSDLAADTLFVLRSEESNRTFGYRLQVLRGWLERMWRR